MVTYGCETWSLALGEEHRLRVFENRVLRRIFGRKRDEVTGGSRKLHNEERLTCTLRQYNKNDRVKEDEMGRACSTNGAKRNAYRILVGTPDNIKMDLRGIVWDGVDWIDMVHDGNQWRLL
jgi:hypothetical protein